MARLIRMLVALAIAGTFAGAAGFIAFAEAVRHMEPGSGPADAIVVLTGDDERISTGMRLMEAGLARRLLISGVHPTTRVPKELKPHIKGSEALVRCCVDIGRDAANTSGNADEARQWAASHGFTSLIVVTSAYHLPRSLADFQRVMPDMRLLGYPVTTSRHLHLETWWRHRPTARLLAGEYVKYVGASIRLGFARIVGNAHPVVPAPAAEPERPSAGRFKTIGAVR